jgi:hypothetical protein
MHRRGKAPKKAPASEARSAISAVAHQFTPARYACPARSCAVDALTSSIISRTHHPDRTAVPIRAGSLAPPGDVRYSRSVRSSEHRIADSIPTCGSTGSQRVHPLVVGP